MKLDYELSKQILAYLEANCNGLQPVHINAGDIAGEHDQAKIDYHLDILADDGLINLMTKLPGTAGTTQVTRLTANGHRVLEVMSNDTLWNKVKATMKGLGIETLKQVPALAIKYFTHSAVA